MKSRERVALERRKLRITSKLAPFGEQLRGSLYKRKIKCGKPGCHCQQGTGHPVTYVSVTFAGGKTVQITVPKDWVARVRTWIANYGDYWKAFEQVSEINRQLLRKRL